jgi:hypothetical protein
MVFEFYDSHADACRAVTKRVLFSKSMMLSGDAPMVCRVVRLQFRLQNDQHRSGVS